MLEKKFRNVTVTAQMRNDANLPFAPPDGDFLWTSYLQPRPCCSSTHLFDCQKTSLKPYQVQLVTGISYFAAPSGYFVNEFHMWLTFITVVVIRPVSQRMHEQHTFSLACMLTNQCIHTESRSDVWAALKQWFRHRVYFCCTVYAQLNWQHTFDAQNKF